MNPLLKITFDEDRAEAIFREEIRKSINEKELSQVFWDMQDLERQTSMSRNFILDTFFYDDRFKKFKIGRKWLFPAKETEDFLLTWLKEQKI